MKQCTKCLEVKPLTEFTPRKDRPGKYISHCKECKRKYSSEYVEKYYWKKKISEKNYKIKNREKVLEQGRKREKIRMSDPEKYAQKKAYNYAYKKSHPQKAKRPFEQGDDVIYQSQKYKVIAIIHGKGHKIRKYGLEPTILIVPKKYLTKKKSTI